MSIPNIIDKIKSKCDIDKITIMYLFIIVGVGMGSFGLGRLSVYNINNNDVNKVMFSGTDSASLLDNIEIKDNNILNKETAGTVSHKEKRYVASKNGKMYYSLGCSSASRIKPENQIWFSTEEEAKKSGYSKSTSCK